MACSSDVVHLILWQLYVELFVRIAIQMPVGGPKLVVTLAFSSDVVHVMLQDLSVELFVRPVLHSQYNPVEGIECCHTIPQTVKENPRARTQESNAPAGMCEWIETCTDRSSTWCPLPQRWVIHLGPFFAFRAGSIKLM